MEAQGDAATLSWHYLGYLTQAGDPASFIIHSKEHSSSLGGISLEELQRFIQGLEENKTIV